MHDGVPETQLEADRYFSNPDNCHNFLVSIRWKDGVRCPHCNSEKVGRFSGKRRLSNCKNCKKQFSVKVGTIFEDSPIGLDKWLPAIWRIIAHKNGVSSCEMAEAIGVTQKTAWFMCHRIRLALEAGTFTKLGAGIVEVDESYIGGKARFMHKNAKKRRGITGRGVTGKTAVMGLLERHSDKKIPSRIIAEVLPFISKELSVAKVRKYVLKDSEIHTDAGTHYEMLKEDFIHKMVDHAECYVKNNVHTNGLENFWSLFKRCIKGTYVQCAPFHLHRYLTEQIYRFNERKLTNQERFFLAVSQIGGKKLSYRELTDG